MDQGKSLLEVLQTPDEDETCRTFILKGEDHTFGNALKYIISLNPDVEHCGYSVPHPSEHDINFRIQTKNVPATVVFKKGLQDLLTMCNHMRKTFEGSVQNFKDSKFDSVERRLEEMDA